MAANGPTKAFAIGNGAMQPWAERLHAAAVASPGGTASPELQTVIDDRRAHAGSWVLIVLIAILVFLMVVKPFA